MAGSSEWFGGIARSWNAKLTLENVDELPNAPPVGVDRSKLTLSDRGVRRPMPNRVTSDRTVAMARIRWRRFLRDEKTSPARIVREDPAGLRRTERLMAPAERSDLTRPAIANVEDMRAACGVAVKPATSRRRRQLVRLADVVGFSTTTSAMTWSTSAKIKNVERMLQARLSRRRGSLAVKRAVDIVGAAFALAPASCRFSHWRRWPSG